MTQTHQPRARARYTRVAAIVLGGFLAAVVVPPAASVAAAVPVTITASRVSLTVGESVRFTGDVSPAQAGTSVALQAFTSGTWRNVAATTLNRRSQYQLSVKPSAVAAVRYRIRTSTATASVAKTVRVFPRASITWSFARSTVGAGESPRMTWRTSSLPSDYRVILQRRAQRATGWESVRSLRPTGTSFIAASVPGRFWYRAAIVAPTRSFVATSTHILNVRPLARACRQDVVMSRLCRFVIAVQTGNVATLSSDERAVAARAKAVPRRSWTLRTCELVGDVTVRCDVRFTRATAGSAPVVATFLLQPTNGDFVDGEIVLPPGVALRYGVIDYLGLRRSS